MPEEREQESIIENILRPKRLSEYIGQENIKSNLDIYIQAAQKRGEPLEHFLFYGPPGLGKTTLANVIAHEMGVNIKTTSGPAIEKTGDLASILSNLQAGDILFIDEIHRLKTSMEEILYSAMEDFVLDIVLGKGPGARSVRLKIPPFTLVGATTQAGSLSAPLRDRFGDVIKLQFYTEPEMKQIILRSSKILEIEIEDAAALKIAQSARSTPRIANRLIKRLRDFAEVKYDGVITAKVAKEGLKALGIDEYGLDHTDREILTTIAEKFEGGPVGLSTLAAATAEEKETIEDVYEPYLLQIGMLKRAPRGRLLTNKAIKYLQNN
ncbi:Holliday junction branch migration DNA helicase RuvB [Candidatus Peregrinibacteria bacterium]|nr:MAG: Holliday junction branch migration DNA helicase RuvB [Candidatus Peregrinibacteria bacterium]